MNPQEGAKPRPLGVGGEREGHEGRRTRPAKETEKMPLQRWTENQIWGPGKDKRHQGWVLIRAQVAESSEIGRPWCLSAKESACVTGDPGSIPVLGRSPGEGMPTHSYYPCLENSMVRGAWQTLASMGSKRESDTTEQLKFSLFFSFRD